MAKYVKGFIVIYRKYQYSSHLGAPCTPGITVISKNLEILDCNQTLVQFFVESASFDSLERLVLAVDLGHDVPQQLGLLLTGQADRQDRR